MLRGASPGLSSSDGNWRSRNPFERADRVNFPTLDESTWRTDPFCSPLSPSDSINSVNALSPASKGWKGWTPASDEPSCHRARRWTADKYLADRQRRGLITPAKTPSDVMKRGALFDDSEGRSPFVSGISSGSLEMSSKSRVWPSCGRLARSPKSGSSSRGLPLVSDQMAAWLVEEQITASESASLLAKSSSWAFMEASTRETEAISVSTTSISFGREDPRVCEVKQPARENFPQARQGKALHVARQLNFDAAGVGTNRDDDSRLNLLDSLAWCSPCETPSSSAELQELSLLSSPCVSTNRPTQSQSTQTDECQTEPNRFRKKPAPLIEKGAEEGVLENCKHRLCDFCGQVRHVEGSAGQRKASASSRSKSAGLKPAVKPAVRPSTLALGLARPKESPWSRSLGQLQAAAELMQHRCEHHCRQGRAKTLASFH
mmetsp:Transcript_23783/g.44938  ORF Transcript_23783/g.44938 Transcript_23783/m.44938 type:complete len:433 (-) Transcript_23783:242-1540(-)